MHGLDQLLGLMALPLRGGDVVLCMGAGSIGAVPARVLDMVAQEAAA